MSRRSARSTRSGQTGRGCPTRGLLYAAAVALLELRAIAASDGTRRGVRDQLFSGLFVPAVESLDGEDAGIGASGAARTGFFDLLRICGDREVVTGKLTIGPGVAL